MELETINKLYLELSQITTARTQRERMILNKLSDIWFELDKGPKSKSTKNAQAMISQIMEDLNNIDICTRR